MSPFSFTFNKMLQIWLKQKNSKVINQINSEKATEVRRPSFY